MSKYRKGSMGASEQKGNTIMAVVATIILVLVYSMLMFDLFNTFLNDWWLKAGWGWHVASVIIALYSIVQAIRIPWMDFELSNAPMHYLTVIGSLGVAIACGCGFDFTLL